MKMFRDKVKCKVCKKRFIVMRHGESANRWVSTDCPMCFARFRVKAGEPDKTE